ncbi:hypothetical protein [Acidipropionibacterium acidipropionici]|uniref:hypothetical protein n=1 Tax=Acidipropionibacterium acidipropionici TaxID=1748 RepID=UPI00048FADB9|nr:hypothetical protein [Acidipropionibacterium acidipropionici]ALN14706.1 hypothetical protein ASQ49_04790 [Acidipropionibacterium acidipropionici]APZ09540.1 hypothetical protein BWX38_10135 [Acidipropionibacterium acidipropionici]
MLRSQVRMATLDKEAGPRSWMDGWRVTWMEIWDQDLAKSSPEGALTHRAMAAIENGLMAALEFRR